MSSRIVIFGCGMVSFPAIQYLHEKHLDLHIDVINNNDEELKVIISSFQPKNHALTKAFLIGREIEIP